MNRAIHLCIFASRFGFTASLAKAGAYLCETGPRRMRLSVDKIDLDRLSQSYLVVKDS